MTTVAFFLQSCDKLQLKMSQNSYKWSKREKYFFATRVGFEPGTAWGLVLMIET